MRQSILIGLALVAAYTLGTIQQPARADLRADSLSDKSTQELLAYLVIAQRDQTDALKGVGKALETFSLNGHALRYEREQAEALASIAKQLGNSRDSETRQALSNLVSQQREQISQQREQTDALKTIARATERIAK